MKSNKIKLFSLLMILCLIGCNNTNNSSSSLETLSSSSSLNNNTSSIDNNSNFESSSSSNENLEILGKYYFNYDSSENFKITIDTISEVNSVKLNDENIKEEDYNFSSDKILIIRNTTIKSYLYGKIILTVNNNLNYEVQIYSETEPSVITESPVTYLGYKNIEFEFKLFSYTFKEVKHNGEVQEKYIEFKGSKLIIKATLMELLGGGTKDFIVTLENDTPNGLVTKDITIQTFSYTFS